MKIVVVGLGYVGLSNTGVGGALGEDRHHGAVDVAVHHRHHICLDAIAIAFVFAAHDHLSAHRVGVAGAEGVGAVGLLRAAAHPVDRHLPQLRSKGLVNLLIGDAINLGLEVGAHHEAALDPLSVLLPDAAALIATEIRVPSVAIFIGGPESRRAVAPKSASTLSVRFRGYGGASSCIGSADSDSGQ